MKNNIGEARRNYADRIGKFTQNDAAEFFGVSLSTYKKWEQGQGMMNGEQLAAIAMKYDVTVDYLLDVTPQTQEPNRAVVDLPDDEREILTYYRSLSAKGKHAVLTGLRDFASS